MTDAMSSLIDGIVYAVKTLINKAEYDQTVSGHILYSLGNHRYVVKVNGEDYIVKSNGLFHAFDSVEVTKPKTNGKMRISHILILLASHRKNYLLKPRLYVKKPKKHVLQMNLSVWLMKRLVRHFMKKCRPNQKNMM